MIGDASQRSTAFLVRVWEEEDGRIAGRVWSEPSAYGADPVVETARSIPELCRLFCAVLEEWAAPDPT